MKIRPAIGLLLTLGLADASAQTPAESDAWYKSSPRRNDFNLAPLPWNKTFTIELPKDWQLVPGFAATLVTAAEDGRSNLPQASIMIEHTENIEPLGPSDVDARLAELEADFAIRRDPGGKIIERQVKDVNKQRFVLIQYSRGGFNGPDLVLVYVIPAGKVTYRLICIAPEKEFAKKYQAMFAHVAWSFKPATAAAK